MRSRKATTAESEEGEFRAFRDRNQPQLLRVQHTWLADTAQDPLKGPWQNLLRELGELAARDGFSHFPWS